MNFLKSKRLNKIICFLFVAVLFLANCSKKELNQLDINNAAHSDTLQDDDESNPDQTKIKSCIRANDQQLTQVNSGANKLKQFLKKCYTETGSKKWCDQVARPNPDSHSVFDCTYSHEQIHAFIHPDEKKWVYAIDAVKLVIELESKGVQIFNIYNWWRPEPYNTNVGGAAGRHPAGTSVDVRFMTKADQNKAHTQLCKWRSQGRLRALGYYSGTGLHLGIGDVNANTWGRACP